MAQVEEMLGDSFEEMEQRFVTGKKEKMASSCQKRFQLLDYDNVLNLNEVMETSVPINGKGNFPSLEVTPSTLVQMVRDGLAKEGIRVPNVRLNGGAATHVLSRGGTHPYKDLDLIFAVDSSEYTDKCTCGVMDSNSNINNNNTYCRTKGFKTAGKKQHQVSQRGNAKTSASDLDSTQEVPNGVQSPTDLQFGGEESTDPEIPDPKTSTSTSSSTSCSSSPQTVLEKNVDFEDLEDTADKDSGYTSSGSSVSSLPVSPAGSYVHPIRSRTHSLDSSSSITSTSSGQLYYRHRDAFDARHGRHAYNKNHPHHDMCVRSRESCWQKIKDVVIAIIRELLPSGVSKTHLTDLVLTDAYVQKMVKITNDVDRWSLISLNNNAGRNLELKFVESMRRQYEFSVDSFQVILDSYQSFKIVSKDLENSDEMKLSSNFFPTILAESVYGDFEAALRHLHHRRICTRRPEQIRGGGLLRYCNLLVRDFTAGEVEGYENDVCNDVIEEDDPSLQNTTMPNPLSVTSQSYSTSRESDVRRLEQLMCSRFFIDFGEFPQQRQKLLNYLESHFANEENLKFQYLLLVRRVVDKGTVCLMTNEKTQIMDFITNLARETLAKDVKSITDINNNKPGQVQTKFQQKIQSPYTTYRANHCPLPQVYQPPPNTYQCQVYQGNQWVHNTNNSNNFNPQYGLPTVPNPGYGQQNYCGNQDPCCYPPQQNYGPNMYPQYVPQQQSPVPLALCPCCQSTYAPMQCKPAYCTENPGNPQVVVTPPRHTMSVESPPFYPASKFAPNAFNNAPRAELVRLSENAKLYYSPAPITNLQTTESIEKNSDDIPISSNVADCNSEHIES